MSIILDGKKLADSILADLKKKVDKSELTLKLAVVLVGDDPISEVYIKQKQRACEYVGIDFDLFKFPSEISIADLKIKIGKIAWNPEVAGVVIQLPLPVKFKVQDFLNLIPLEKDVDVLSEAGIAKFYSGNSIVFPPTVCAISQLLAAYNISLEGKNIVIVGAGRLIGLPLTLWLSKEGATVSVLNKSTEDISFFCEKADVIISGAGKPNLITGKMIKKGAVVVDAGSSSEEGKTVGDIDFESVSKKASYVTPVPGGVGPMTVACLLKNTVELYKKYNNIKI